MLAYIMLGAVLILCLFLLAQWYVGADPKDILRLLRWGAALAVLLLILWFLFSGRLAWAVAAIPALFIWFRRFWGWFGIGMEARRWYKRAKGQENANAGQSGAPRKSGPMTREEALAILGLTEGATREEIKAAYHRLITQMHPDKGGSDYLAAQINQARDVLLDD